MENKVVGYVMLCIAAILTIITLLFNKSLQAAIKSTCGMSSCSMYDTVSIQTYFALAIVGLLIVFSFVLIFSKQKEKIILKKIKQVKEKKDYSLLTKEEKHVLDLVEQNKAIFQADLIEKSGLGKVKISRLLDRLENQGFVERKRRGMTNIVIMKD